MTIKALRKMLKSLASKKLDDLNLSDDERNFLKLLVKPEGFSFTYDFLLTYCAIPTEIVLSDYLGNHQDERIVEKNNNVREGYIYQGTMILDEIKKGNIPDNYLIAAAKIEYAIICATIARPSKNNWTAGGKIRPPRVTEIRQEFRSRDINDYLKDEFKTCVN